MCVCVSIKEISFSHFYLWGRKELFVETSESRKVVLILSHTHLTLVSWPVVLILQSCLPGEDPLTCRREWDLGVCSCSLRALLLVGLISCTPSSHWSFTKQPALHTAPSISGTLSSIKSQFIFFCSLRPLKQTKCIFSFSSQHSRKYLRLSIKRASIHRWCEKKGQSIVCWIYSICIRNCVQFTNSLFYNLVHLTAAGGQTMEGL